MKSRCPILPTGPTVLLRRQLSPLWVTTFSTLVIGCGSPEPKGDDTQADVTPPAVLQASVTPNQAAVGTEITITLQFDEPLGGGTTIAFIAGESFAALVVDDGDGDPATLSATYVVTGTEDEGIAQVTATFEDAAGNGATDVGVGTVSLDFTPPEVVLLTASKPFVRAGVDGLVACSATEPVQAGPKAHFVGGELDGVPLEWLDGPSAVITFRYRPDGTEPEGPTAIAVTLVDMVGNQAELGPFDGFTLDFTAPALVGGPNLPVDPVSLSSETMLTISLTADEPLGQGSMHLVSQDGVTRIALTCSPEEGYGLAGTLLLGTCASCAAGTWQVEADFWDQAGNATVDVALGSVVLVD